RAAREEDRYGLDEDRLRGGLGRGLELELRPRLRGGPREELARPFEEPRVHGLVAGVDAGDLADLAPDVLRGLVDALVVDERSLRVEEAAVLRIVGQLDVLEHPLGVLERVHA